jgi:hypothetical protein
VHQASGIPPQVARAVIVGVGIFSLLQYGDNQIERDNIVKRTTKSSCANGSNGR